MGPFLIFLLALQLFDTRTLSEVLYGPLDTVNSLNDKWKDYSLFLRPAFPNGNDELLDDENVSDDINDITYEDVPDVQNFPDKTEVKFRQPFESVNVDYLRNAIVLKFRKNNAKSGMKLDSMENEKKKKTLQDNFIRFGKRSYEEFPVRTNLEEGFRDNTHGMRLERSHQTSRDARGDNFMRFGRSGNVKNDFMRFGRGANDFMRFGRSPSQDFMRFGRATGSNNFMRFGRGAGQDFMRFGRTPNKDFMRFGRTPSDDFMRFGRNPNQDFMRLGRTANQDVLRFGRNPQDNFMRFGRNTLKIPVNTNFMRYSRPDNFMRFGRAPLQASDSFMHFDKSIEKPSNKNASQPVMDKNALKQAVKLIHDADKNADNENPVDKAIKVLFDKHLQHDAYDKATSNELMNDETSQQHIDNNGLDTDIDYFSKMSE